jgi:hypothetical protein
MRWRTSGHARFNRNNDSSAAQTHAQSRLWGPARPLKPSIPELRRGLQEAGGTKRCGLLSDASSAPPPSVSKIQIAIERWARVASNYTVESL